MPRFLHRTKIISLYVGIVTLFFLPVSLLAQALGRIKEGVEAANRGDLDLAIQRFPWRLTVAIFPGNILRMPTTTGGRDRSNVNEAATADGKLKLNSRSATFIN